VYGTLCACCDDNSRAVFHPLCVMSSIRVLYFSSFSRIFSGGNLSLQYVNSTNWIVTVGVGVCGGGDDHVGG
jgi:hypothetical protein